MKTKLLVTLFLTLGLLAACAEMNPHPMDMNLALQNAKTKADHEELAKHYEEAAEEMQVKADEHKKLLGQYESQKLSLRQTGGRFKSALPKTDRCL